jgi:hypothetical protein
MAIPRVGHRGLAPTPPAPSNPALSEIETFLHYGFVPRVPADLEQRPWVRARTRGEPGPGEEPFLAKGRDALAALFEDVPAGLQVVPLSGGLDSRVILGMLAARGLGARLLAVTFGTPGTFDYELAGAVARQCGVRHEKIDLTREPLEEPELLAEIRRARASPGAPWLHAIEAAFNALVPRRFGAGATLWSGIMANSINGSRLGDPRADWPAACRAYARESLAVRSLSLTRPGYDPCAALPAEPLLPRSSLTYAEQLHMTFHYPCRFEPVLLAPGFSYRTPFRDPRWCDFALSVPMDLRRGEGLFRALIRRELPELMALPTKNQDGLPLTAAPWRVRLARDRQRLARRLRRLLPGLSFGPAPGANYLDFERDLRRATAVRQIVERCLERLVRRGLVDWLDPLELWQRHQRRRANLGDALVQLALLDLNLEAAAGPDRP